ncbi:MAG TPA: R3H domain-containing nucleic acid-binding protein, partial [Ilumatobacteraceae bacterium]|nr:R3H domain-containing nucleic acid-binding protein [Ilumatobacteraceae bacterium]
PKQAAKPRQTTVNDEVVEAADMPARTTPKPMREQQDVSAQQVGDEARKFIDELVAAFAFTGTTELIEDGDDLEVRVHGENLGLLVGPRGTTLQAVQDLARVASQRRLGDHDTRLRVDIGGYRQRRKEALDRFAVQMAEEVKQSGVARVLEPMSSADRKIVHDALSEVEGIGTRSEGDDPYRRVVITPANG